MPATRRGRRRSKLQVRLEGDFFYDGRPDPALARHMLRAIDETLARTALAGVTVTPQTPVRELFRRIRTVAIGTDLIGPAALLACSGGRYAEDSCHDLFTGWKTARDLLRLPGPLRVAQHLGSAFTGTVAELTEVATGVDSPSAAVLR